MIAWWLSALFAIGGYAYGYFYGRDLLLWQLREEIDAAEQAINDAREELASNADLFHAMREEWDNEDSND